MPNGGIDNCGMCAFNEAVQRAMREGGSVDPQEPTRCTLHGAPIRNPYWTYCPSHRYHRTSPEVLARVEPRGPITSVGLGRMYERVPWHGISEPKRGSMERCLVCDQEKDRGIVVEHEGEPVGFCSLDHYLTWWTTQHGELPSARRRRRKS